MAGLERWVPSSMKVKDSKMMGNAVGKTGSAIGDALVAYGVARVQAVLKGAEMDHERELLEKHQANTKDLLTSLPTGTTELEHETKGGKTRIKVSGAGTGTVAPYIPPTRAEVKPIPKAAINKHVSLHLKVHGLGKKATPQDHADLNISYGKLVGAHGQRRVDAAIKEALSKVNTTPAPTTKKPTAAAVSRQNKAAASYITPSGGKKLDPAVKAQNAAARSYMTKLTESK